MIASAVTLSDNTGAISELTFTVGGAAQEVTANVEGCQATVSQNGDQTFAEGTTASVSGTTVTVTPGTTAGYALVTVSKDGLDSAQLVVTVMPKEETGNEAETASIAETNVAKIGDTGYATLAAAITAANASTSDCEITLLQNISITETQDADALVINNTNAKVTLNLNGQKLTLTKNGTSLSTPLIKVSTSFDLTGNGTIELDFNSNGGYGIYVDGSSATFTMKNGTINAINGNNTGIDQDSNNANRIIAMVNGSTGTFEGGKIVSEGNNYASVIVNMNSNVAISGGEYKRTVTVSSGDWGGLLDSYNAVSYSISGGYFDGTLMVGSHTEGYNGFQISGGKFTTSNNLSNYVVTGYHVNDNGDGTYTVTNKYTITYNTNGGSAVASTTGTALPTTLPTTTKTGYTFLGWYIDATFATPATAGAAITANTTLYAKWTQYVAKVGDQSFTTFAEAVAYAKTNSATEITLLSDIEITDTVILGNDSKSSYTTDTNTAWTSLTKINGVKNADATTAIDKYYTITVSGSGKLVMDYWYTQTPVTFDVNIIDNTTTGGLCLKAYNATYPFTFNGNVKIGSGSTTTGCIYYGSVEASALNDGLSYYHGDVTAVTISGGTYYSDVTASTISRGSFYGNVTINDGGSISLGTFYNTDQYDYLKGKLASGKTLIYYNTYLQVGTTSILSTLTKNGVTYDCSYASTYALAYATSGDTVTLKAANRYALVLPTGVTLVVPSNVTNTGAISAKDSAYTVGDPVTDASGNKIYTTSKLTSGVASITVDGDTSYYPTLTKALAAAVDGNQIDLLAESSENVSIKKGVTLNTNGYSVGTVSSADATCKIVENDNIYSLQALTADDTETVAQNGETYYSSVSAAVAAAADGDTVKVIRTATETNPIYTAANCAVTLDLNGQTINSSGNYALNICYQNSKLTVTGSGTLNHTGSIAFGRSYYATSTLEIRGNGTYTTTCSTAFTRGYTAAVINLYGGTYNKNVANFCAEGYTCVESGSNYIVAELSADNATASITNATGTTYYATVAKAIAGAKDGNTVVLLKTSSENVTLPTGIQLNANGQEYTGTVSAPDYEHKIVIIGEGTARVFSVAAVIADEAEASVEISGVTHYYDTLRHAISTYQYYSGTTIKLLKDITITDTLGSFKIGSYTYNYFLANSCNANIDGSYEENGVIKSHSITYDSSTISYAFNTFNGSLKNIDFKGMNFTIVCYTRSNVTFDNVDAYGTIEAGGNDAAYLYQPYAAVTFKDCTNYTEITGQGGQYDYNAIFVGMETSSTTSVTFTNCVNKGSLICGKAAMFLCNPCFGTTLVMNVENCSNEGTIISTYVDNVYKQNYYIATVSGVPTLKLNGAEININSTYANLTATADDTLVTNTGVVYNGPITTGMQLTVNDDGTYTIIPATNNKITVNAETEAEEIKDVSYYVVGSGLYVGITGGSNRFYATETISSTGAAKYRSTLKDLKFIDSVFVNGGETSTLAGNKTYTKDGVTYYVVRNNETTNNNQPESATMYFLSAYDEDGNLLASVQSSGETENEDVASITTGEGDEAVTTYYATLADAITAVTNGQEIDVLKNIDVTGLVTINKSDVDFTIDLNGYKIERTDGSIFDIYSKVTFKDSSAEGTGTIKAKGRALYGNEGADFTLESGNIISTEGSAVNVIGDYGSSETLSKFTMNGGSIVTEVEKGQGVYISSNKYGAQFIMNGGTISAAHDCGVVIFTSSDETPATFTMTAGSISSGGEAAVDANGSHAGITINISGGTITGTETNTLGIFNSLADLTISGGTITGSTALGVKGGNVNISDGATLIATGVAADPTEAVGGSGGINDTGDALYIEANYGTGDGVAHNIAVNITGGTFTSANNHAIAADFKATTTHTTPTVTISGGLFKSAADKNVIATGNNFDGTISISGGYFSTTETNRTSELTPYIVEGKVAIDNNGLVVDKTTYPTTIGTNTSTPVVIEVRSGLKADNTTSVANITGGGQYLAGQDVKLAAPIVENMKFDGWFVYSNNSATGTAVSTEYNYTFTATTDASYIAIYEPKSSATVEIKAKPNDTNMGTVKIDNAVAEQKDVSVGTKVTLTAEKAEGNRFLYWTNSNGRVVSTSDSVETTALRASSYQAVFSTSSNALVIFRDESGSLLKAQAYTSDEASAVTNAVAPTKKGYEFTGWTDLDGNELSDTQVAQKINEATSKTVDIQANYKVIATYNATLIMISEDGTVLNTVTSENRAVGTPAKFEVTQTTGELNFQGFYGTYNSETKEFNNLLTTSLTYTANPDNNLTVYAKYGTDTVTEKYASVTLEHPIATYTNASKHTFTMSWNLPDECTLVSAGFKRGLTKELKGKTSYTKLTGNSGSYAMHVDEERYENDKYYVQAFVTYSYNGTEYTISTGTVGTYAEAIGNNGVQSNYYETVGYNQLIKDGYCDASVKNDPQYETIIASSNNNNQ